MVKELIEKLHTIDKKINSFVNEKKGIVEELLSHGYYINEQGEVVENKKTLGLFWKIDYCDYYVGEHGMYNMEGEGATEISENELKEIEEAFEKKKFKKISTFLERKTTFPSYVFSNTLKYGLVNDVGLEDYDEDELTPFQLDDTLLFKWKTDQYGDDEEEMDYGSKFEIRETTLKEIEETPFRFEKDILK